VARIWFVAAVDDVFAPCAASVSAFWSSEMLDPIA
jgi:hypothetical protein